MFVVECSRVALFLSSLGIVVLAAVADQEELPNQIAQPGDSLSLMKRSISDENLVFNVSISLSPLSKEQVGVCYGGNTAGLGDTSLTLQYRADIDQNDSEGNVKWIEKRRGIPLLSDTLLFSIVANRASAEVGKCVEFRLVQKEHGGGSCNCWAAENIRVNNTAGMQSLGNHFYTCNTTASQHRILTCAYCSNGSADASLSCTNTTTEYTPTKSKPFTVNSCSGKPHLNVFFQLIASEKNFCNTITTFNEGVEFSVQLDGSKTWIPLAVIFHNHGMDNGIVLGNMSNLVIRNFPVNQDMLIELNRTEYFVNVSLRLCDFERIPEVVQFRWLQTSRFTGSNNERDIWGLDSINIGYVLESGEVNFLLVDSFESNQLNYSVWPQEGIRDAALSTECTIEPGNQALMFGLNSINIENANRIVYSRSIRTALINFGDTLSCGTVLQSVQCVINSNLKLLSIVNADPVEAIELLGNLTASAEPPDPAVSLYLLGDILNRYNSTARNMEDQTLFVEGFLEIGEDIIANSDIQNSVASIEVVGSSLLSVVERLTLEAFPQTGNFSSGNITVETAIVSTEMTKGHVTSVNSRIINDSFPIQSIEVPSELIQALANHSFRDSGNLQIVSSLFYNVERLFPGRADLNSSLGSGIVSTSFQCGNVLCDTRPVQLKNPVIITIQHSGAELMNQSSEAYESFCVFWDFNSESSGELPLLTSGQWSSDGCFKNTELSNSSLTVCECNHLTHFAILLSPVPLNITNRDRLSLEVISIVGVTISLIAMAITIATFIVFRSLHNMRTYIHTNLCINLMIAQLIFIVGSDRSADDHVPVHCQVIAVLLHYFFLVSFMWMLMEGVVLYFILIKVFVTQTKKLILGFTIASYGTPLLYMGLLTLPLGFSLPNQHYGSTYVCFLNAETHFVWAFIAPVLVIIIMNTGFLIMAGLALWRLRKNQKGETEKKKLLVWVKVLSLLLLIMGLTWIFGILVVDEALLPLAYIHACLVALQGFFIFLSTVVFQKTVRDEYLKCFKKGIKRSDVLSNALTSTFSKSKMEAKNGEYIDECKTTGEYIDECKTTDIDASASVVSRA